MAAAVPEMTTPLFTPQTPLPANHARLGSAGGKDGIDNNNNSSPLPIEGASELFQLPSFRTEALSLRTQQLPGPALPSCHKTPASAHHLVPAPSRDLPTSPIKKQGVAGSASKSKPRTAAKVAQPDIPLHCIICNIPSFSDASHLFTHCLSRSHDQRYVALRDLSREDADIAKDFNAFEDWYYGFGVNKHVLKRRKEKKAKEDRKLADAGKRKQGTANQPSMALSKKRKMGKRPTQKAPEDEASGSVAPPILTARTATHGLEQSLRELPFDLSGGGPNSYNSGFHDSGEPQHQLSYFGTPHDAASVQPVQSPNGSAFVPSDEAEEAYEDDNANGTGTSSRTQLKGVYWPGMDLFDSATAEKRKKRNQRKDNSVINRMRLDSEAIEPTEIVTDMNLVFERTRDIYDTPTEDESTPVKASKSKKYFSSRKPRADRSSSSKATTPSSAAKTASRTGQQVSTKKNMAKKSNSKQVRASASKLRKKAESLDQMQPKKRKPRGSAARAKAKITKQAQLQSDAELDGEEDDDYDENSSMLADASQESGPPGTRDNSNQSSFEVNAPKTQNGQIGAENDVDAFRDDDSTSGAFSQYSGSGINRADSRSSGIFSIASDMGIMGHQQNVAPPGLALQDMPRGIWAGNAGSQDFNMPIVPAYGNSYFPHSMHHQGIASQGPNVNFQAQMPYDDFHANMFRPMPHSGQHAIWNGINGNVGGNPGSYFDSHWLSNSQNASYDPKEQYPNMFEGL